MARNHGLFLTCVSAFSLWKKCRRVELNVWHCCTGICAACVCKKNCYIGCRLVAWHHKVRKKNNLHRQSKHLFHHPQEVNGDQEDDKQCRTPDLDDKRWQKFSREHIWQYDTDKSDNSLNQTSTKLGSTLRIETKSLERLPTVWAVNGSTRLQKDWHNKIDFNEVMYTLFRV